MVICKKIVSDILFQKQKKFLSHTFSNILFRKNMNMASSVDKYVGFRECYSMQMKPASIIQRAKELSIYCNEIYNNIASIPDAEVSYNSVLKVLTDMSNEFISTRYFLIFPQHVCTDASLRSASTESKKLLDACLIDLKLREDVFQKLLVLQKKNEKMLPEAHRLLEHTIREGKRNGLHLPKDIQNELGSIKKDISSLCTNFCKNLNEVTTKLEFTEEELQGLPHQFIQGLDKKADTGMYLVGLSYPEYFPIMRNAKNPETRRRLYVAFNSRCKEENSGILEKVRKLRHKHAVILGYPNHASYITETLMSKKATTVEQFLEEIQQRFKPFYEKERKQMLDLKKKECSELNLPFNNKIDAWDTNYYLTKTEKIHYSVDKEKLKQYFPLEKVREGLLYIYQHILGLEFTEIENAETWHKDVKLFKVQDANSKELMGYFFLDMFPREGKYSHACLMELQAGCLNANGTRQISIAALLMNFSKPQPDCPSLLDHEEVKTFFHEFGHVMHYICAQADFAEFSNTRVERDFLETPSQMLENWCYSKPCLELMSSHFADQSTIHDEILEALIKAKNANSGHFFLRQNVYALYDFGFHSSDKDDTKSLLSELFKKTLDLDIPEETDAPSSFSHLCNDYDARYYGYMWSLMYSDDMFQTHFKDNVLNPSVGMNYRTKILQPGASKDAIDLLHDFLGREPSTESFWCSRGLTAN